MPTATTHGRPETALAHAPAAPLAATLGQLTDVIEAMSDDQYVGKPVGVMESSVGGQVRHVLDHVRSFLDALDGGDLDYDRRERGTAVETGR